MNILAVGSNNAILQELSATLSAMDPSVCVEAKTDPLMAGKYSFTHCVDMLIAEMDMKRMDGIQLIDFVRHEHPNVLTFLIVKPADYETYLISETEGLTGILPYPFTGDALANLLISTKQRGSSHD